MLLLNAEKFADAVKQLKSFTASKDTRPALCGIHMTYEAGADSLRLEATDSFMASYMVLPVEQPDSVGADLIIKPVDYKPGKGAELVGLDLENLLIKDSSQIVAINQIDGTPYPSLEKIFPDFNNYEYEISFKAEQLQKLLKASKKDDVLTFRCRGVKPAELIRYRKEETRAIIAPCKPRG